MKELLGWMHRKFRQNSGDPYQNFNATVEAIDPCNRHSGRPSPEERSLRQYCCYGYQTPSMLSPFQQRDDQCFYLESNGGGGREEENTPPMEELFHGLLAIGTLGSVGEADGEVEDDTDPVTPTFAAPIVPTLPSADAIAGEEEQCEATQDDLMFINAELEKVLMMPEAEKTEKLTSSAQASQVSTKQLVVTSRPLQEYLLGSSVDVKETTAKAAGTPEKKERHRTSLGELFMRSKMAEEGGKEEEEEITGKPTVGMYSIAKKMLKCRRFATCKAPGHGDRNSGKSKSETKFRRVMQMFHRKVHPESSMATEKEIKSGKSWSKALSKTSGKGVMSCFMGKEAGQFWKKEVQEEDQVDGVALMAAAAVSGEDCGDFSGNKEYWIKTDADYLVLEL